MRTVLACALLVSPIGIWHDTHVHLTLRYPARLHVTTAQLSGITDPVERVALYSGSPPNAMVAPRARQVIAIVMEQEPPVAVEVARFPPRPRHFRIRRLTRLEGFSGRRWAEITFRDHGRAFYLFIGVGSRADAQVPRLLRALDSLRVGAV
jgi:hypothetical protein